MQLIIYMYITTEKEPFLKRYESEKFYYDPSSGKKLAFNSVFDSPSLLLSVVIPAYNEQGRSKLLLVFVQNSVKMN